MDSKLRIIVGLAVVIVGVFWGEIKGWIPSAPKPQPPIEIVEPSSDVLKKVSRVSDLVTDEGDRLNLAVFNKVFSDRVVGYDATSQQVNDVYTKAGKIVFDTSLRGKYNGYSSGVTDLFRSTLGSKNSKVTKEQGERLSEDFSGLAYSFIN